MECAFNSLALISSEMWVDHDFFPGDLYADLRVITIEPRGLNLSVARAPIQVPPFAAPAPSPVPCARHLPGAQQQRNKMIYAPCTVVGEIKINNQIILPTIFLPAMAERVSVIF